ncbi:MBL fold metallo-hydrolase [bacterium]|nr:MBL fold metallo-hydrolase [bacterium]
MSLKISRILHAGYVFECESTQIAFDPIFENPFSRNCHAFPNVSFDTEKIKNLKFNAIFISHFHDDHCSFESLNLLDRNTPIYMYCFYEEMFVLLRELGFKFVFPLKIDVPVKIGSIEVIPRRALDADIDSIFHIKASGLNVLNVVDSWIDEETLEKLSEFAPWDMVLWPFQTMREVEVIAPSKAKPPEKELPSEWIHQLKILKPKYIVPSSCQFVMESWSWYNHAFFPVSYRQFKFEIELALPDVKVVRLNPSVSVTLDEQFLEASAPLSWVTPVGEQDVDYEYIADLTPPSTAEIAKRFAKLTDAQSEKVFEYCLLGLIEKYKSIDAPADEYFKNNRLWKLSVYDHTGKNTDFFYNLKGSDIEITSPQSAVNWATSVPISKLYAALELGESLTSMYVRIEDAEFEDIVDDPLIRCLFNGVFGAYQEAQLKLVRKAVLV